jgi:hypothetical protein
MSRFHLKTEIESSLRNSVLQIKDRTMDNVQSYDTYLTYHRHKCVDPNEFEDYVTAPQTLFIERC